MQNAATTQAILLNRILYEPQEHSLPYGMHRLILIAVLLNLILPLSGLLYDNHMAKSEPGWRFGGLTDFLKRESTAFSVGTLSAHTIHAVIISSP